LREDRSIRRLAVAAAVIVGALATPAVAAAAFQDGTIAAGVVRTDVLLPPTAFTAGAGTCTPLSGDRIVLSWTASASTWRDGYEIARATSAGGPYTVIAGVSGSAVTYTDGPLSFSTTYHYAVRTKRNAWRSVDVTASRTTRNGLCG